MGLYLGATSVGGGSGGLTDSGIAALVPDTGTATGAALSTTYAPRTIDTTDLHNERIAGGLTNAMDAQGSFYGNLMVGGGGQAGASPNLMTGQASLRTIIGGYDNHLGPSLAAGIIHGQHHIIDDGSTHGFLAGGSLHTTTDSDYSTGVGGTGHTIGATGKQANYAAIVGGQTNSVLEYHSGVVAGLNNLVDDGGVASFIAAGSGNIERGSYSLMAGSTNLAGTVANPTYGSYSLVTGLSNQIGQTADASYAVALGRDHRIDVQNGTALGKGARPGHQGAVAHALGSAVTAGDRQVTRNVVRREISAIIATGLYLDTTGSLVMPDNTSWGFTFDVLARRSSDGATAHWTIAGTVKRGAGAATTALVGTYALDTLASDVPAWVCDVVADTTNGGPLVRVKPDTTTTVSCVARMESLQVVA